MKVSGTAVLNGPIETVYAVLHDPEVLVRTIPGCQRLEQVGFDAYRATVVAGVASISGSFSGQVQLADQKPPHSFVLHAVGSGVPGTVSADVTVTLTGDGDATLLAYDAEAVVGGMVGGVGQRVLAGVARRTADEFFAAVDTVLTGAEPLTEVAVAVPVDAEVDVGPAVFTRPAGMPAPAGGLLPGGGFALGVAVGAGITLLGALVGGLIAGRVARRR